jgi:FtsZ-binding cell division protein ZapB
MKKKVGFFKKIKFQKLISILKNLKKKDKVNDVTNQLKMAKSTNNNLKQELEDYKSKATKILQSKDKLIASLKDGVVNLNEDDINIGNDSSRINLKLIEIEELKNERDYLKEELQSKNVAIELLKNEIQVCFPLLYL